MIKKTNRLTAVEESAIRDLLTLSKKVDGLVREPYLSNQLNADLTMPAFILFMEDGILLGFLAIYADDVYEPEISLLVHPEHRHKGIARALLDTYKEIAQAYQLGQPTFVIEKRFLKAYPTLLENFGLKVVADDSEFFMERGRTPISVSAKDDLLVTHASSEHVAAIAAFQQEAFENNAEISLQYARVAIEGENNRLYVALENEEVVASCSVDTSTAYNYLYGIAVRADKRGQGIGSYLIASVIQERLKVDTRPFQLAVEESNLAAKTLYERLGFTVQTKVLYLQAS